MNKDIKVTKGIKPSTMGNRHMGLVVSNSTFCEKFFKRTPMHILSDDNREIDVKSSLIYDMSKRANSDKEILQNIIDLLSQLRASQSDQNVFVQNNTVVRQQILNQLKNELLNVRNNLSSGQVQKLEIISNNNFDEKTLNDILKSLLEDSKKKSQDSFGVGRISLHRDTEHNINVSSRIFRNYNKFINLQSKYTDIISTVSKGEIIERSIQEKRLINVVKPVVRPTEQDLSTDRKPVAVQRNIKEIFSREQNSKEIVHPVENITRSYKEKNLISKHIDKVRSKLIESDVYRSLYSRDFNYLIQKDIKDRYEKLVESSENRVLSTRKIKESNLVNRREVKVTEEEKTDLISRVSDIESKTTLLNKQVNKSVRRNHEIIENIISKDFLNKDIIDVYNKFISRKSNKEEIKKLISKAKTSIITHNINKYDRLIEDNLELNNINKVLSYVNSRHLQKKSLVNTIDAENVNRRQLQIKRDVINKYNIKATDISDEVSVTRLINKVNLINQNVKNNIKLQDIENRVEQINKNIVETESRKKVHNRIFNRYDTEERIKRTPRIYNEIQARHNKSILEIDESTKYNRVLDRHNIYRKKLSINKTLEDRENLIKEIQQSVSKPQKLISHKNIINKVNNIENKGELLTRVDINKVISENREISSNVIKTYLSKVNQKFDINEIEISKVDNIYKDIVNKIKEKHILSRDIVNREQFEEVINRNIEQRKNILIKKPVSMNYKEIESQIKATSQEIINKKLGVVKSEHIKKRFIDEEKVFDVKKVREEITKSPLIIKENIKNASNIENIISEKISSFVTPKIRKVDKYIVNERNIYREIKETPKSYFDNINERIEERVLLNRQHNVSEENVRRDIQRSTVIYKTPISLKEIEDKIESVDKKSAKTPPLSGYQRYKTQESQPINMPRELRTEPQSKVKTLQEKDVMRMIESYMSRIDIDTISDTIMDRVEEEMLSQRRRSGLI